MDCPKCKVGRLSPVSIQMNVRSGKPRLELLDLEQCGGCHGVWFDRGELEKYLDAELTVLDASELPASIHAEHDTKPADCPKCKKAMERGPAPKGKVQVDRCRHCAGVWLDGREIDVLEKANRSVLTRFSSWLEDALPESWFDDWSARRK